MTSKGAVLLGRGILGMDGFGAWDGMGWVIANWYGGRGRKWSLERRFAGN